MVVGVLAGGATVVAPAPSVAQQLADETCALALTKTDPALVNAAFPDQAAVYWSGAYQLAPGTRLRIEGQFPHARYISFNVYDAAARPIDALSDVQLLPIPGDDNPFLPGADRTTRARRYTAFIEHAPIPEKREPNTLYSGSGQNGVPNTSGTFIYRLYMPDEGRDDTGDVGIPAITVEPTTAPKTPLSEPSSPCSTVEKPPVAGPNETLAGSPATPASPSTAPEQPIWRKFTNFADAYGHVVGETAPPLEGPVEQADLAQNGGSGGFLSNRDNSYLSARLAQGHGAVSVTRVRPPSFADTRKGAVRMPSSDLRYWSMCMNDPNSTRYVACSTDDVTVLGADGFATFVVSTPETRPANARAECGVTWLPWGPNPSGLLIFRHMLPRAGFAQSIQAAKPGAEAATMGDGYPVSRYVSDAATYDKEPCASPALAAALPTAGTGTSAKRCRSARRFTIRLPKLPGLRVRDVRVTLDGRRLRVRRDRRGRLVATVDLRRATKSTARVRIVVRRSSGRRLVAERRYRTCAKRRT